MIKAIFFDFDGTLANTAPGIVLTMQETFLRMGLPAPEDAAVRQTIGLPLIEAVRMLGHLSDEDAHRAVEIYREIFPIYELTHVTIFPEVAQTLRVLAEKGLTLAVCTSRDRASLETILSHHGLASFFGERITNNDHLTPKPAPDMVLELLRRTGLRKDEAVVVGDTIYDIEMGNRAGCRTVAVTYGNHSREQLLSASPTHMIDRFAELTGCL